MNEKELTTPFFLSCFSHEIRTPLNGVVGYSQLLSQTNLSTIQKEYVSSMNKCCIQLMELLNDVIDYSKLIIGKMPIKEECFSISEIIDVVENTMNCRIREKQQKCHYAISRNIPDYIVSDKQKIIQILINLVSNANKFSHVGGFISVHISPKEQNKIQFTVKDNGIGISEIEQKNLFNIFYRSESMEESTSGSGLGLAICKRLVELLEGNITVNSTKGKGSSFSFTVKYKPYVDLQKNLRSLRGKFILIVDESIDDRIMIGEILFENRMKPIVCATEEEAIHLLEGKRYKFSLIVTSIPSTRLIEKNDSKLPIVGFFKNANFTRVLKKPINKISLLTEIHNIVSRTQESIVLEKEEESYQESIDDFNSDSETEYKDVRILITEDTEHHLDILCKTLNILGYTNIDTARNGKIAIEKIDTEIELKENYDLILLDIRMPLIDGFEVAKHAIERGNADRVVMITASVMESDRERCKELGIKYFISKPYRIEQIKSVIDRII